MWCRSTELEERATDLIDTRFIHKSMELGVYANMIEVYGRGS